MLVPFLQAEGPPLDGVVFLDACDGYRRLHDVWQQHLTTPVLAFLDVPRRTDVQGEEYFARALWNMVRRLEERLQTTLRPETLSEAIILYNEQRRHWAKLSQLRAAGLVPAYDYYALRTRLLQDDPLLVNEELARLLTTPRQSVQSNGRTRVMVVGSVVIKTGLIDTIKEAGAEVVVEDSCVDQRAQVREVQSTGSLEEMIRDLAAAYLNKPPCPRMRDLHTRLSYLIGLARENHANGLVCSYYKFCDMFLGEYPLLKAQMDRQGLPVLLVEDEGESALSGQVRTRLEAFLEVLGDAR
jgi:benzoyl-CoA reductase/2-hydroxyglutaryl-CoA dehydratase subunit BcrC/BadD/HgdB